MSEMQRKLTTIFSADVQDYTRLMGADEEGTLATLKRYRDTMSRLIGARGGRMINTWGDGLIGEFPSVVEAVRTAVDIQNELAGLNAARPADGRMMFRIGINLGDIIVEGDDIYGDGVNIAARLQSMAPAGGIVISNTVYDQVRNKLAIGFDFLGTLEVKNVAEAVPSYAVRIGDVTGIPQVATREQPRTAGKPSERPTPRAYKSIGFLAVVAAVLVGINVLSWHGEFWAAWPLLVFAVLSTLTWTRRQNRVDAGIASLAIVGLGIVGINLLSWHGEFWAIWPLLAVGAAAGFR
ncbi:adenylate/guanylate cyclase domain-containing protein [Rhizobium sp. KVB221]|uniref:Adenylate/guanylate cyclase domain-containing protein n=1 Tax=Rhizobium setariae TaxID=2801340 RepID=A0A937CQJ8_9HYPH|nr:adenylate/guanylate cyclase domain-containing protein [Rhizobium setariae]MBL0373117.1 adenylate/guanylate cyclase domain-containing protein [Rhizobium setariae]